jgi:hypothetical protein
MKKTTIALVILIVCTGIFVFFQSGKIQKELVMPLREQTLPIVQVSLNDGSSAPAAINIQATTAYDALFLAAKEKGKTVQAKKYDFGVFVEKIGELGNTKDNVWIYYVNGKSGTVAADKQPLKAGDTVEWKYEKSIYE